MRRAILVAALAAPAAAMAQTTAAGQIVFTEGSSDLVHGPWISLAECVDGNASVNVSWRTRLLSGVPAFPAGATSQLYASNAPAAGDACRTFDDATAGVKAYHVGGAVAGASQAVDLQPRWIVEILSAAGIADCSAVSADTSVHLCVQAYSADLSPIGIATGTMTLSVSVPAAPTNATAVPADDGALQIAWTAPAGDPPAYDYRIVVQAEPPDARDPAVHEAMDVRALSYAMSGLVNDVPYGIRVYARSRAGNESAPSTEAIATPLRPACMLRCAIPSPPGGGGGCASGGAGPIALLALAALLARRRRGR